LQADGVTFNFPEIFKESKSPLKKQIAEYKQQDRTRIEAENKDWDRLTIPPWFRYFA
jgi:hypothetical protein